MKPIALGKFSFERGYASSVSRTIQQRILAFGSKNVIVNGTAYARNFRGCTLVAGQLGSRQMFQADASYSGLGDGNQIGEGSIFKAVKVLMNIGTGKVRHKGVDTGAVATSTLAYQKKIGSTFAGVNFQAGHAIPSAPTIYPKKPVGAGKEPMSGAVAVVVWRFDAHTGQVSLMSLPSNVLTLNEESCIVKINASADANGQDYWGYGVTKPGFGSFPVFYVLPIALGGEVAESTLSYTRAVTGASILDTTNTVNITDPDAADQFTAADIGRRIAFGAFSSWITGIISPTSCTVNDENTTGGTVSGTATVTHAVNGITRAIEISWTVEALVASNAKLAPEDAYPPPAGRFAGMIKDTMFVETADGIIYVGIPGYLGSFPPSRAMFPSDPAVLYLDASENVVWRITKNGITVLSYIGGSNPLELQTAIKGYGINLPQNAALGYGGRLMMFSGKPLIFGGGVPEQPPHYNLVEKDFFGWHLQTAASPVVAAYDPENYYELWMKGKIVMAHHAPSGTWCAPIDLTNHVIGDIVSAVVADQQLRIGASDGATIRQYLFDVGTGSTAIYQTPDLPSRAFSDTIRQIQAIVRTDNALEAKLEIIKNFDSSVPVWTYFFTPTGADETKNIPSRRPNIRRCRQHAARVTLTSSGGNAGVDSIETFGVPSHLYFEPTSTGARVAVSAAGSDSTAYRAAIALGGLRIVRLNADNELDYVDSATAAHANKAIGLTVGAVEQDATGRVREEGELTDGSWTWSPGDNIFCGANGVPTQTAPTTGFVQRIGYAVNATTIFVEIGDAIVLA